MSNINFVALDFETATSNRASACEVGLTFVEGGEIVKSEAWFIKPFCNRFDEMSINIHGITPDMTSSAPSFAEQWETLSSRLKGKTVVAHYAPFDMGVIRDECLRCGVPLPEFRFIDSCYLARFVVPGIESYSLDTICNHFGIGTEGHHRSEADALMCAKLMLALCEKAKVKSVDELIKKYKYNFGYFADGEYKPFHRIRDYSGKNTIENFLRDYVPDKSEFDEENPFYGQEVVFTGKMMFERKELMKLVMDVGGMTKDDVTKSTDYLVVSHFDYKKIASGKMSGKLKKAMKQIEEGVPMTVLEEKEFLIMIGDIDKLHQYEMWEKVLPACFE